MTYKGVDSPEGKTVEFKGEPIPAVPYTDSSGSDLDWGYVGAGPNNTARSILEHAQTKGVCENIDPANHHVEFTKEFILKFENEGWTIELSEIKEWCENR